MTGTDRPVPHEDPGRVARFKKAYAVRRQRQSLSTIPVGVLAILVAAGGDGLLGLGQSATLGIAGAVILGFFGFSLVNWRCPACDSYLGQRLNPKNCPSCGQELR